MGFGVRLYTDIGSTQKFEKRTETTAPHRRVARSYLYYLYWFDISVLVFFRNQLHAFREVICVSNGESV